MAARNILIDSPYFPDVFKCPDTSPDTTLDELRTDAANTLDIPVENCVLRFADGTDLVRGTVGELPGDGKTETHLHLAPTRPDDAENGWPKTLKFSHAGKPYAVSVRRGALAGSVNTYLCQVRGIAGAVRHRGNRLDAMVDLYALMKTHPETQFDVEAIAPVVVVVESANGHELNGYRTSPYISIGAMVNDLAREMKLPADQVALCAAGSTAPLPENASVHTYLTATDSKRDHHFKIRPRDGATWGPVLVPIGTRGLPPADKKSMCVNHTSTVADANRAGKSMFGVAVATCDGKRWLAPDANLHEYLRANPGATLTYVREMITLPVKAPSSIVMFVGSGYTTARHVAAFVALSADIASGTAYLRADARTVDDEELAYTLVDQKLELGLR